MEDVSKSNDFQLGMAGASGPSRAGVAESAGAVRRRPERRQRAWVAQGADDRVSAGHAVWRMAEVVEHLEGSRFCAPLKAREGVAGRDATDPQRWVALWWYACVRGRGSARELARQCEEPAALRGLCGGVSVHPRRRSDFRTDGAVAGSEKAARANGRASRSRPAGREDSHPRAAPRPKHRRLLASARRKTSHRQNP
jgi:hypothetical protein